MSGALAPGGVRSAWVATRARVRPWLPALLLALACWTGVLLNLGGFALFDVDEGAFAEASREMLARGDGVSTWLNGQPRFDKPILIYWLQAGAVTALGLNEFALRLPSALAALGWIAAIYAFAREEAGTASARAAAWLAATTVGVNVIGRGATADALLNLLLALSMFDMFRYLRDGLPRQRHRVYLWIGLGLLAKGPVAALIPGAVSAIVFGLHGRGRAWWRALCDPWGWLLLLAIAGPWYWAAYARHGQAFIDGFLMRHNVGRFLAPMQGHGGGLLYYLPVALLLLMPYSGLFLRALPGLRQARARALDTFLWGWFLFVLVFFSLSGTKLPHYLLYGVTPLFIVMARARFSLHGRALAFAAPLLLTGVIVALPNALQLAGPHIHDVYLRNMLTQEDAFSAWWRVGAAMAMLAVLALSVWPGEQQWRRLAASGLVCSSAVALLLVPALARLQQEPVRQAALFARQAQLDVRAWRINVPSFSVYRQAVTPWVGSLGPGQTVLTRSSELGDLGPHTVLFRRGGVVLARVAP